MVVINPSELSELLDYHPETGEFFWKPRRASLFANKQAASAWDTRYAGRAALNCPSHGYLYGRIFGRAYSAHRVAWAMTHGKWPKVIDHVNGNPADNRISNLRNVESQVNSTNCKRSAGNSSGVTGVFWLTKRAKWQAGIKVHGKYEYLGIFDNLEAAAAARKTAEIKHGFHPNHGRSS